MNKLVIATRESKLAVTQANLIKSLLEEYHPELSVELLGITTKGDKIQDRPLAEVGGKGLFLKELQQALLEKKADIAVHSAKDVPVEEFSGLCFTAFCQRQDPRDVLVSKKYKNFTSLPKGAIVGTSSCRRKAQLLSHRPDLNIQDLRGNVDTRLKKLHNGDYDAIVLAAAGLIRLGLKDQITEYFATDFMLPAVGQGALIIEARSDDKETLELVKCLHEPKVASQVQAERGFTKALQGDCYSPIGVHAAIEKSQIILNGLVVSPDGIKKVRAKQSAPIKEAQKLAAELASHILELGGREILQEAAK